MRFLLIPLTGIGNTIQFTPVIRNLKRAFPKSELIILAASDTAAEVVADSSFVSKTVVHRNRCLKSWLYMCLKLRLRYGRMDTILAPSGMPVFCDRLFGARCVITFARRGGAISGRRGRGTRWVSLERNVSLNEVQELFRLLEPLGIEETDQTDLFCNKEDYFYPRSISEEFQIQKRNPLFALHSQCDMKEKKWGDEAFARLAHLLLESYPNCGVLLLGGQGERVEHIVQAVGDETRCLNLVGRTTIPQTAAIIQRCQLVISNDSSVAHMAAAVDTPVLTIFGPTDPRRCAPWNPGGIVRVVTAGLECSPCYFLYSGHIACRYGNDDIRCMKRLPPQRILAEVHHIMEKLRRRRK